MGDDAVQAKRGFSLIEMLVVTAILGIVITAIGACLGAGLRLWDAAQGFNVTESDAIMGLGLLQRDLRNAADLYDVPYKGCEAEISIPGSIGPDASGAYDIGHIRYLYDLESRALWREEVPVDGERTRAERLAVNVLGFHLEYADADGDASDCITSMPSQVQVTLELESDAGPMALVRNVVIPTGDAP